MTMIKEEEAVQMLLDEAKKCGLEMSKEEARAEFIEYCENDFRKWREGLIVGYMDMFPIGREEAKRIANDLIEESGMCDEASNI